MGPIIQTLNRLKNTYLGPVKEKRPDDEFWYWVRNYQEARVAFSNATLPEGVDTAIASMNFALRKIRDELYSLDPGREALTPLLPWLHLVGGEE